VLGGGLVIEETPGGGTTMVLTLDAATQEGPDGADAGGST